MVIVYVRFGNGRELEFADVRIGLGNERFVYVRAAFVRMSGESGLIFNP